MTPEEHKMVVEIHQALFAVPPGSPPDEKPLLEDIRVVCRAYKRAKWTTRAIIWLLPTAAGLGMAVETIWKWMHRT